MAVNQSAIRVHVLDTCVTQRGAVVEAKRANVVTDSIDASLPVESCYRDSKRQDSTKEKSRMLKFRHTVRIHTRADEVSQEKGIRNKVLNKQHKIQTLKGELSPNFTF